MKLKLTMIALAVTAFASPSFAADVAKPIKPAPVIVAPAAFDWHGFYLGLNGGGGWGQEDCTSCSSSANDFSISGPFVGGQVGFNIAHGGGLVWGLEADAQWSGIDGLCNGSSDCNGPPQLTVQDINSFGTVRGRLGMLHGSQLWYVTGGWAFANATRTSSVAGAATVNHTGWVAGGGVEWVMTSKVTGKIEYQYLNFGGANYALPGPGPDPDVALTAHTLRFGLNWHL